MNLDQVKKVLIIVNLIIAAILMSGIIAVYVDVRWFSNPEPVPTDQWYEDQLNDVPPAPSE